MLTISPPICYFKSILEIENEQNNPLVVVSTKCGERRERKKKQKKEKIHTSEGVKNIHNVLQHKKKANKSQQVNE
jgi:hypothetical protein